MYEANLAVSGFHSIYRWGNNDVITNILAENQSGGLEIDISELRGYIQGILFLPALFLCLLVFWMIVLSVAKCFGKRAGVVAGNPMEENIRSNKVRCPTLLVITASFCIACVGIMFIVKGATSSQNVLDDIKDGTDGLQSITNAVKTTLGDAIAFGEETIPVKDDLVTRIEGGLCVSQSPEFDSTADDINNGANQVLSALTEIKDFSSNELSSIVDTFEENFSTEDTIDDVLSKGETYSKPAVYSAAPIALLGLVFFVSGFLSWRVTGCKPYFCIQTWLLLPVFFVVIVVTTILAAGSAIVLTFNADVCLGGPEETPEGTIRLLMNKYAGIESNAEDALNYYIVNSCEGDFPLLNNIATLETDLREGKESMVALSSILESDPDIASQCGLDETTFNEVIDALQNTTDAYETFLSIVDDGQAAVECDKINAVFVDIVHDALCDSFPNTLLWIFSTMATVSVLGMLIFLYRGALLPPNREYGKYEGVYYTKEESSLGENQGEC